MPQPPTPTVFSILAEPELLQAVYNPIRLQVSKTNYVIGQQFFCEIWTVPRTDIWQTDTPRTGAVLLQTLKLNGPGDGTSTFDLSGILRTRFTHSTAQVPATGLQLQKDDSATVVYFVKAGYLTYNARNEEQRVYGYETAGVCFALRAALPLGVGGSLQEYRYRFDAEPVRFLTALPDGAMRRRSETTYLPFFLALNRQAGAANALVTVRADLTFAAGEFEEGFHVADLQIPTGGMYLLDAKPAFLLTHPNYARLVKYSIYLEYEDDENQARTMTQSREFLVAEDQPAPVGVTFLNRLAAWDHLQFRSEQEAELKVKSNVFAAGSGLRTYQVDTSTTTTYHSSWLTRAEYQWLKDLMTSTAVYVDGEYVRPLDTTFKFDSTLGLFAFELTVAPAAEENTISL